MKKEKIKLEKCSGKGSCDINASRVVNDIIRSNEAKELAKLKDKNCIGGKIVKWILWTG